MVADGSRGDDWKLRWPAGAERIEVWDGRLMFELRGFSRSEWTDEDIRAAQRCYPNQRVTLSASRAVLFVEPPEPGHDLSKATSQNGRTVTA